MPGMLQVTSPLPNQSNNGPMPSLSSAMNPSSDTAARFMIVLVMVSSFRLRASRSIHGLSPCDRFAAEIVYASAEHRLLRDRAPWPEWYHDGVEFPNAL